MKNYLTVVFEYEDSNAFAKKLISHLGKKEGVEGLMVTAISCQDEISRVEDFEDQALADRSYNS